MPSAIKIQMGAGDWAKLVLLSLLWGGSFFFIEVALTQLPPFTIVVMRLGLGAIALWVIVFFMRAAMPNDWRVWLVLVGLAAIGNALPFSLIVWSQIQITSGLASILNATTPLFAVIVASMFLADERASVSKVIGVLIGFGGVVVMFGESALTGSTPLLPQLAMLVATLSYAIAGAFGRRLKRMGVNVFVSAAGQISAAFIILLPVALYFEGFPNLAELSFSVWGALGGLAILSTAVAYIVYFSLLKHVGATNVLLATLLIPVSAIGLGVLILGESIQLTQLLGMACIAFGLLVIDGRLVRLLRSFIPNSK